MALWLFHAKVRGSIGKSGARESLSEPINVRRVRDLSDPHGIGSRHVVGSDAGFSPAEANLFLFLSFLIYYY